MISKGTIRYIKSLQLKKYRNKAQSFLVEGAKSVLELIPAKFEVTHVICTESFLKDNAQILTKLEVTPELVTGKQLSTLSSLKTNETVLAVAKFLPNEELTIDPDEYGIALDRIRDPGNLGTIIRTADWYGIKKILCSADCADFYNPKVIHASMGSFTRVRAYYTDLKKSLAGYRVYGASLQGENVHNLVFSEGGIILIGNEAQGLSEELNSLVSNWVSIPRFGAAESLNAAIATAVICDNLRKQGK